jgi:hypothetical protein
VQAFSSGILPSVPNERLRKIFALYLDDHHSHFSVVHICYGLLRCQRLLTLNEMEDNLPVVSFEDMVTFEDVVSFFSHYPVPNEEFRLQWCCTCEVSGIKCFQRFPTCEGFECSLSQVCCRSCTPAFLA